jgi:hypothetical protein
MAWLIRRRAELRGAIDRIDKQLEDLPRKRLELAEALQALDQVIPLHEVKVEPQTIQGIRPTKARLMPHGAMTRYILECLRKAEGKPVRTIEIAYYVARAANINVEAVSRKALTTRVRHRLQGLREDGVVVSSHELTPGNIEEGRWSLSTGEERKAA